MPRIPQWDWIVNRKNNYESHCFAVRNRIICEQTGLHKVMILNTFAYGAMLFLDDSLQSSELDEFIYHETLVHPAIINTAENISVLIIGGSEGATLKEVLKHRNVIKADMVDIDGKLVEICKEHLLNWHQGAFLDQRVSLFIGDGLEFLKKERKYDVIIFDLTEPSPNSHSTGLFSMESLETVKKSLNPGGIFCTNICLLDLHGNEIFKKTLMEIKRTFAYAYPFCSCIPSFSGLFSFAVASDSKFNPKKTSKKEIKQRIKSEISGKLRFYDENMHRALFALPPYVERQ